MPPVKEDIHNKITTIYNAMSQEQITQLVAETCHILLGPYGWVADFPCLHVIKKIYVRINPSLLACGLTWTGTTQDNKLLVFIEIGPQAHVVELINTVLHEMAHMFDKVKASILFPLLAFQDESAWDPDHDAVWRSLNAYLIQSFACSPMGEIMKSISEAAMGLGGDLRRLLCISIRVSLKMQ
jgi:hypothetical protein